MEQPNLRKLLLIACLYLPIAAFAQQYTPQNAHAHNDYLNKRPFYDAYAAGFGSIEADIFCINNELYVAHDRGKIEKQRTLQALYLVPLARSLGSDSSRHISLLVDIKDDHTGTLPVLINQLEPLRKFITSRRLSIIISGNRPLPAAFKNYPDMVLFDDDQSAGYTPRQWKRVGLVSLPFPRLSKWKAETPLPKEDAARLKHTIDSVHTAGKRIRFWAAPDNKMAWETLKDLNADLIGTDKVIELGNFLQNSKN